MLVCLGVHLIVLIDVVHVVGVVLDNRRMLLLAKKIGSDWEPLGQVLEVPDEELAEIRESEGGTYQGAFKMLWAWRQTQPQLEDEKSVETLRSALQKVDKQSLADQLGAS